MTLCRFTNTNTHHQHPSTTQLSLYIFKKGSSVLFTIASALRLPIVDFLLLSTFIAGEASVNRLSVYDYYALFILIIGIAVYYTKKEKQGKLLGTQKDVDDDGFFVGRFQETTINPAIASPDVVLHSPHGGGAHLNFPSHSQRFNANLITRDDFDLGSTTPLLSRPMVE